MSHSLHAAHYADQARQLRVQIVENTQIARDTYRVRVLCPEIAVRIVPGQFVMLRIAGANDPLLARPLAFYDTVLAQGDSGEPIGLDVVYLVVGKMTSRLSQLSADQELDIWGPLGNGFQAASRGSQTASAPEHAAKHLVMVAGGIGQTPFLALARQRLGLRQYGAAKQPPGPGKSASQHQTRVTFCYGARTRDYLAGVDDFRALGVEVKISTDDGTEGHHGLVTDLLRQTLDASPEGPEAGVQVVCCGPERMMEAVAELCAGQGVPCEVSLETPMACGIGICFSCVARVRDEQGGWDYRRTCVEGPVFDAASIVW